MDANRTILMVDDVGMFRELGALFLARTARVITAASAEEALAIARVEVPDLVVTDLKMPGMDGAELCHAIKSDPLLERTPVIVMVGSPDARERGRAVRAGADDLLAKPLSRLSLIEAVNRFVRFDGVRGLPRVELAEPIELAEDRRASGWGMARNLSRGGVFVESDRTWAPKTELDLRFTLPESEQEVAPTAQVVWRREADAGAPGMGLRFIEVDGAQARWLEEFVFQNAMVRSVGLGGTS